LFYGQINNNDFQFQSILLLEFTMVMRYTAWSHPQNILHAVHVFPLSILHFQLFSYHVFPL